MYFYKLSTDDVYFYSDEGGGRHHITKGAIQIPLIHKEEFLPEVFQTQLKEAYKASMKFAPDRLRRVATGQTLHVPFERVVEAICRLYGYEKITFTDSYNFDKKVEYDEYGEIPSEEYLKNILIEEKPKKKSKSAHVFSFDDDIDDLFEEFFNEEEEEEKAPAPSPLNNRRTQIKDEDLDDLFSGFFEEESQVAPSPGTITKGVPKQTAVETDEDIFLDFFEKEKEQGSVCATTAQGTVDGEMAAPEDPEEAEDIFSEWFND